ncbi:Myb-like_DNA-binding domain-containing protein [Hexamita inflata]|uniref:Myb-like DNA-binding domain-containing protein n=1 Tax=Hexamita inflata TaxID=28002 RepID=A0AA86UY53_9EUKA|nr:Myb-like DNA-binding domain-containing protein [Hexamita inflata]
MPAGNKQRWSQEDELLYETLLIQCERDFKLMAEHFPGRSYNQIRSHYYNMAKKSEEMDRSFEENKGFVPIQSGTFEEKPVACVTQNVSPLNQPAKRIDSEDCSEANIPESVSYFYSVFGV